MDSVIAGRYRVIRRAGRGALGVVYVGATMPESLVIQRDAP